MSLIVIDITSPDEVRQELTRRRKALELEAMQSQSFESLCSVAHRFGELCEEEDALNNAQYARSGLWRMN